MWRQDAIHTCLGVKSLLNTVCIVQIKILTNKLIRVFVIGEVFVYRSGIWHDYHYYLEASAVDCMIDNVLRVVMVLMGCFDHFAYYY